MSKKKSKKINPLKIRFKWATLIELVSIIIQVLLVFYVSGLVTAEPSSTVLQVVLGLVAFIFILMSVVCVSILRYGRGIKENADERELENTGSNFIGDTLPLIIVVMITGLAYIALIVFSFTNAKDEEERVDFFKYAIYSASVGSVVVFSIFLYRAILQLSSANKEETTAQKLAKILLDEQ